MKKRNPIKIRVDLSFDNYHDIYQLHTSLFLEESSPQLKKALLQIEKALDEFEIINNN